jgi:hypothetical protein
MCKKIIFGLVLALFLVSFISASQENLGIYAQGDEITLLQICGTCTYNNLTSIVYPNGSHQVLDALMTKRGAEFTYTFTDTSQEGEYLVSGHGDLDGTDNAWAYTFEVTDSGKMGISIEWMLVIAMALALFLIIYGVSIEHHPIYTIGAMLCLMIAFYIFTNGFGALGSRNLISWMIAGANLVVGAIFSIRSLQNL